MTRRRADKLDPHSREARRVNGFKRMEIELPIADAHALDVFAAHHGLSRSKAILRLIRFGPPADPLDSYQPPCLTCGAIGGNVNCDECRSPDFEKSLPDP